MKAPNKVKALTGQTWKISRPRTLWFAEYTFRHDKQSHTTRLKARSFKKLVIEITARGLESIEATKYVYEMEKSIRRDTYRIAGLIEKQIAFCSPFANIFPPGVLPNH